MKEAYYNALLDAFYEGNTTLEEEKALKAFFESDRVPFELLEEKKRFLACYEALDVNVPEGLLGRLEALIDEKSQRQPRPLFKATWIWTTSAAASLLLFFSIGLSTFNAPASGVPYTDTFTNPTDAALEADRAVQLIANKLNSGYRQLDCANARIEKTEKTVTEQLIKMSK